VRQLAGAARLRRRCRRRRRRERRWPSRRRCSRGCRLRLRRADPLLHPADPRLGIIDVAGRRGEITHLRVELASPARQGGVHSRQPYASDALPPPTPLATSVAPVMARIREWHQSTPRINRHRGVRIQSARSTGAWRGQPFYRQPGIRNDWIVPATLYETGPAARGGPRSPLHLSVSAMYSTRIRCLQSQS
jgi:hypothetical protein